jgi:hypothetical protein
VKLTRRIAGCPPQETTKDAGGRRIDGSTIKGEPMNATSTIPDSDVRLFMASDHSWCRVATLVAALCGLAVSLDVEAGKPGGQPGSGAKVPPNPDIVYMSAASNNFSTSELRGVTLSPDRMTSTDSSLLKSATDRELYSVAWSPDGSRFAWIERGAIMAAAPGGKPTVLYAPASPGDPIVLGNPDTLAWARDCANSAASVLVFHSGGPYALQLIKIGSDGTVTGPELLYDNSSEFVGIDPVTGAEIWAASYSASFAFSPTGQHLAFFAYSKRLDPGIHTIAMCPIQGSAARGEPEMLVPAQDLQGFGADPVISVDWSRSGRRLALPVTTSTDSAYPWRDLRVVDLEYSVNVTKGIESVVYYGSVRTLDSLAQHFGSASSELSPQWDPSSAGESCERLAFSQSSDTGRKLYLVDFSTGTGCSGTPETPQLVSAKNPRALAWRLKN